MVTELIEKSAEKDSLSILKELKVVIITSTLSAVVPSSVVRHLQLINASNSKF